MTLLPTVVQTEARWLELSGQVLYVASKRCKSIRTGRPRQFDRQEALQRAMALFWAQGYEGTTLADLQKEMGGITAPSFYSAFGSKEALFREAVELYKETQGAPISKALAEGATARASIDGMLRAAVKSVCGQRNPSGCLMVLGGINCTPANQGVGVFLREERSLREKFIRQRLRRGVADGDVPAGIDINTSSSFFASIADGLAMRARDGASRKTLNGIVDYAMAAWDNIAGETADRRKQSG
jgi:AcrR family transcriptional regulator